MAVKEVEVYFVLVQTFFILHEHVKGAPISSSSNLTTQSESLVNKPTFPTYNVDNGGVKVENTSSKNVMAVIHVDVVTKFEPTTLKNSYSSNRATDSVRKRKIPPSLLKFNNSNAPAYGGLILVAVIFALAIVTFIGVLIWRRYKRWRRILKPPPEDVNELVECEELPRNEEDEDADKEDTDELDDETKLVADPEPSL